MKKSTILILAAAGVAAALFLTSKRGRKMTQDLADNADEWKESWNKFAGTTGSRITHLMEALSHELSGMTSDAKEKILAILNDKTHNGQHIKN
jgi:gas vesicle protein